MSDNCAQESADVILAAGSLNDHSLSFMLGWFSRAANNTGRLGPGEREMLHSVARLLARVRDMREANDRALNRLDRQTRLQKRGKTSEDQRLDSEFAAIVGNDK